MKILQLGKFYPIRGGVEKVMWDLTRGLSARGVDCDMVCAMLPSDGIDEVDKSRLESAPGAWPRILRFNPNGRCICLKALTKAAATMISPAMVRWVSRHASEYDVIHVHHPDPMACLALRLSSYKGKVVLHWHSDILKQKGLLKLYLPLQRWLVRRADRIVGTTPVYVAQSPFLAGVQDKVTYLPIGIEDSMAFSSPPVHMATGGHGFVEGTAGREDEVLVFSLGRLVEYKGYAYLVEAAKWLPDNYRIVIGGKGPLHDQLLGMAESLPEGSAKVELAGFLSDRRARELFNTCSLFVLPSVMKTEAFGIVQLEAMSCSKPVIATHIEGSGTDWVNANGESGLNVPCRDAKALADAILAVTSDPVTLAGYGERARKRYESLFTYDKMIDGCLKIYGE